ncbi:MAG: TonB-dependent receptor, partial [Bacteroidota bacterium]
ENEFFGLRYFSGIRDWSGRIDFDYVPRPEHYIRFGASAIAHRFSPGASQFESEDAFERVDTTFAPSPPIDAGEFAAYIEDDMTLGSRLKVNAGLHASALTVGDEVYTSLQPRLSTRFFVTADWALKASFASMAQYIHLLTNSGIGLPTDLWLPATERVPPQRAWQAAAGVARTFPERGLEFSIEGYYKAMRNLIEFKPGANFIGIDTDWQDKVEIGEGWSYGAEVFLQKQTGRVSGWLGYTLSWTDRQFDNLNEGIRFPYRYDRRHDISAVVNYEWKANRTLSASWVYGTGNAITLPIALHAGRQGPHVGSFGGFLDDVQVYTDRNGYRMRAYHRLDIGINFTKKKRWGERTLSIGAYNTYNRRNPFYIYLGEESTGPFTRERVFKQVSLFPIIPSFNYSFTF